MWMFLRMFCDSAEWIMSLLVSLIAAEVACQEDRFISTTVKKKEKNPNLYIVLKLSERA